MEPPPEAPLRFVGLDVHKRYVVVAAIDAQQKIVLPPRRLDLSEFEQWIGKNLKPTDAVVLESASNAWHRHDQIKPLVASVTVAHPLMVKLITAARVKTDSRDVLSLARLLAAGLIPAVWVPPPEVRELRALVAHRRRLVTQRTQARNRLHSILHRHNLFPPSGDLLAAAHRSWWDGLGLPPSERLRAKQDLALLDCLQPLIKEVEAELTRLSTSEPWADQVPFLVQLPGIGVLSAMVLLSAIGDISRFPSAKKLVGYAGLGAAVHDSGQSRHTGHITKQGRKEIRHTLVEVAWAAVEHYAYWKALFGRLTTRMARSKAIVAVARKLLVTVWHVLTHRQADRRAEAEKVAFKFIAWAADLGKDGRQGLKTTAFVRRQLTVVGTGQSLESLSRSGRTYRLPPLEATTGQAI
jgi:transposase